MRGGGRSRRPRQRPRPGDRARGGARRTAAASSWARPRAAARASTDRACRRRCRRGAVRPRRPPAAPSGAGAAARRRTAARSSCRWSWSRSISRISSSAARASESSTASRISSRSPSASSTNGTPRKIISGVGDRAAVLLGDRRDDDEDAVGREHAAVAQRDVLDVADVDAVDEDHAGLLVLAEARAAARRSRAAGRCRPMKMSSRVDADRLGQLAVQAQPLVVAVDRHHVARLWSRLSISFSSSA